jgi:hypothetical protein
MIRKESKDVIEQAQNKDQNIQVLFMYTETIKRYKEEIHTNVANRPIERVKEE